MKYIKASRVKHFRDKGYIYAANKYFIVPAKLLKYRCAYNPGHFHSSNLTYDVESFNEQIIVSSSFYLHTESEERNMERVILSSLHYPK